MTTMELFKPFAYGAGSDEYTAENKQIKYVLRYMPKIRNLSPFLGMDRKQWGFGAVPVKRNTVSSYLVWIWMLYLWKSFSIKMSNKYKTVNVITTLLHWGCSHESTCCSYLKTKHTLQKEVENSRFKMCLLCTTCPSNL